VRCFQKFGLVTFSYLVLQLFTNWSIRKTSIGCGVTQKKNQAIAQKSLGSQPLPGTPMGGMPLNFFAGFFGIKLQKVARFFPNL
jgi:hypothetical protein